LANSLLVGLSAAKAIALAQQIPLLGINHLHAHVYACRLAAGREIFPCVGLIISGGHTHLFHYRDPLDAKPLGGTIDDAAGEAFDKVATLLGLGYPGGPALSRLAESGDPQAIRFPRSFIHESRLDFSFSGLKTAVRYAISPQGSAERSIRDLAPRQLADIAASFELAVAETIAIKAGQAMSQTGERRLCVGGGVAANRVVRRELEQAATRLGFELLLAPRELCTDNAVMGAIAWEKYWRGQFDGLDLEIAPGLLR
jgi:N6-L-threonylcarbamoyladenine synthase